MTINRAIECAELMSRKMVPRDFDNDEDRCVFGMICADALHLMKTHGEKTKLGSEPNEPDPDTNTWQERMKREYHETKERYEKLNRLLVKPRNRSRNWLSAGLTGSGSYRVLRAHHIAHPV